LSKSVAAATTSALSFAAAPHEAFASANESISDVALANVNILGVIAVALFIIIPVSFLVILYVKSTAEGNVSGGFSQSYYDESKKMGKKLTNEAAVMKGKGLGMRPQK
jgi:photosystem II PsbM protein